MSSTDEELRKAADLKLWMESRIGELQEEIDKLKEALALVDSLLRTSSFRPATDVPSAKAKQPLPQRREQEVEKGQASELREIRRDKGGEVIAEAIITRDRLSVEPLAEVNLRADTPPLKSFLLGKILGGMKKEDEALVAKGTLDKGDEIAFSLLEKNGKIEKITVDRYREKERLTDLINTIAWTFSRMLEK